MNYLAGIAAFTVSLAIGITAFADSTATYTNTDNTVNVTETEVDASHALPSRAGASGRS